MPVSSALMQLSGDRIQPIDLIHGHDLLDDEVFQSVLLLASSGGVGAALPVPYCSKNSRATLRAPGPAPVRTPVYRGLPSNTPQQQLAVEESAAIHDRSRILLSSVDQQVELVILENPATSMTWDDPLVYQWVQAVVPYAAQACACMFGKNWGGKLGCLLQTALTSMRWRNLAFMAWSSSADRWGAHAGWYIHEPHHSGIST